MRKRSTALVAVVLLVANVTFACGDDEPSATTASTSTTASTTTSTSSPAATETTASSSTTTTTSASGTVPPAVREVDAGPSAGSGEIQLDWSGVTGAEGYRVYRADAEGGPFEIAADLDVASGDATKADGVTNVWSPPPGEYEYIEFGEATRRYFKVTAYNAVGESLPSAVVCGAPTGRPDC